MSPLSAGNVQSRSKQPRSCRGNEAVGTGSPIVPPPHVVGYDLLRRFGSGRRVSVGLVSALVAVVAWSHRAQAAEAQLPPPAGITADFIRDVRPIFEAHCLECHGPKKQRSDYRLDVKKIAFEGGVGGAPIIVPGKSAESLMIQYVAGLDEDMTMPPKGDPLTRDQIGVLRAWIDQGAVWPDEASAVVADGTDWWSLQPLTRPPVPAIAATTAAAAVNGSGNEIDAFVRTKLADKSLTLSPPADRRTLLRRASLILTGLPPTPEETAAFERSADPAAYEKAVDRLLASPHFGERWAQHWLDVVRFAETNGSESNLYRTNAWPYRDYVIRAYNEDKPLDRFIHEQIAGDILGVDEATGFLVAGMFVTPDTVGKEEQAIKQARSDRLDETVQTVSASLLGLTMSCARCHNHKFDPIPQHDYYALTAVFAGLDYGHRRWQTRPDTAERAAAAARVERELAAVREKLGQLTASWTEEWPSHRETHFRPIRTNALRFTFPAKQATAIDEIEVFGPAAGGRNLALAAHGGRARSYKAVENELRPVSNVIDGHADRFRNWRPREGDGGGDSPSWIEIELSQAAIVDRIAISTDRDTLLTTDYLLEGPTNGPRAYRLEVRTADGDWQSVAAVTGPAEKTSAEVAALLATTGRLARELGELQPPPVFAGYFRTPEKTHLFGRGDPMDPREEVVPNALSALQANLGLRSEADDAVRRLAFARWLTDPKKNPLTPRVLANRVWMHVFGHGIVDTPGDFGRVGGTPTHPELLDWLADELVTGGWSLKALVRRLVTSEVFRQSSAPNEAFAELDANALYLWRFPPRRVEAEVLRDATLQIAGSLDPTMGGPGFRIHADKKRFESWRVADNASPATWRRMIYQERMRGIDDRMFTAFDRPDCGQVTPRRTISTTPLQALNLFNGEFLVTQARQLAERVTRETVGDPAAQIERVFSLVFCRAPTAVELKAARELVATDGLPALCRALLNTNEYAFLE